MTTNATTTSTTFSAANHFEKPSTSRLATRTKRATSTTKRRISKYSTKIAPDAYFAPRTARKSGLGARVSRASFVTPRSLHSVKNLSFFTRSSTRGARSSMRLEAQVEQDESSSSPTTVAIASKTCACTTTAALASQASVPAWASSSYLNGVTADTTAPIAASKSWPESYLRAASSKSNGEVHAVIRRIADALRTRIAHGGHFDALTRWPPSSAARQRTGASCRPSTTCVA
mmetsp:Transcript_30202/g.93461  ORF Transcript_30202/g.93461 Transcript_30202/m.93461 type:complete len:231 (+) Transcript_30202:419-1111(+)